MTPIKVFIFEDEWMVREALTSIINKSNHGMTVVGEADNAESGIDAALEARPDVVLMDLRLKGRIGGIDAMARLIARQPACKIIVFTSYPDKETLRASVDAGAQGYLLKREVTDPATIVNAIREVHAGHSYLTPTMTAQILDIVRKSGCDDEFNLSGREKEVLGLIAAGHGNKHIAGILGIDERTVANHVSRILDKMKANNRTDAVVKARDRGLIKGNSKPCG